MSKPNISVGQDDTIMTVREVATYLKLSECTVRRWAKESKIPCHKLGRQWRFKKSEIDVWLQNESQFLLRVVPE